jgi:hypothetical protein
MSLFPQSLVLFAQRNRFGNLSEAFRARQDSAVDREEILYGLLILAGIVGGIWLLSRWLGSRDRHRAYDNPRRLFLGLCRAHRLRWSDRWLLWQVAKWQRLRDPARVFLEPERLEKQNLSPALRAQAARLQSLRDRLFADLRNSDRGNGREASPAPARVPNKPPSPASPRRPTPLLPPVSPPVLDVPPWPPVEQPFGVR